MFANIVELEFAKQKHNLMSVLFVIAVTLTTAFAQSLFRHAHVVETLKALLVLCVLCLPGVAVIFAVSAAAGLHSGHRKLAEEGLPFSPRLRVLGAYLTSLALFAVLAALLLLLAWRAGGFNFHEDVTVLHSMWFLSFGVLFLHLLAFAFAYWTERALLGGGLAVVAAGLTYVCLRSFEALHDYPLFDTGWENLTRSVIAYGFVACSVAFAALWLMAPYKERDKPLRFAGVGIALALSLAPLLSFGGILWRAHVLESRLYPLVSWNWLVSANNELYQSPPSGALLQTRAGSIVRVLADGSRTVLFKSPGVSLFELPALSLSIRSYLLDPHGTLWMVLCPDFLRNGNLYEVWRSTGGKPMEQFTTFRSEEIEPRSLAIVENQTYVCGSSTSEFACAALTNPGKPPVWRRLTTGKEQSAFSGLTRDYALALLSETGEAASLSKDRSTLTWTGRLGAIHWTLPGPAQAQLAGESRYVSPAYFLQGLPVFVLPVKDNTNGEQRLILCLPNGGVQDPWKRTWGEDPMRASDVQGGTVWTSGPWHRKERLVAIDSEGKTYTHVEIAGLFDQSGMLRPSGKPDDPISVFPLRIYNSQLWLILQGSLLQVDLQTGKVIRTTVLLTQNESMWNAVNLWPCKEGVYFINKNEIRLITWDGALKNLGNAELPAR